MKSYAQTGFGRILRLHLFFCCLDLAGELLATARDTQRYATKPSCRGKATGKPKIMMRENTVKTSTSGRKPNVAGKRTLNAIQD